MTRIQQDAPDVAAWWKRLSGEQKAKVREWLQTNRPPRGWTDTEHAYAFLEMPGVGL